MLSLLKILIDELTVKVMIILFNISFLVDINGCCKGELYYRAIKARVMTTMRKRGYHADIVVLHVQSRL